MLDPADQKPSDENLILAAGRGDREAFRQWVERHHASVGRFIMRILGSHDRAAAEDISQDVFWAAWRSARSFRPERSALAWLLRIAANRCFNYRRDSRLRRTRDFPGDAAAPIVSGDDAPDPEQARRVQAAIASLPLNQRTAIVLRHFHDSSYVDIADILDVSISAVESLLFRARRTLETRLGETPRHPNPSRQRLSKYA